MSEKKSKKLSKIVEKGEYGERIRYPLKTDYIRHLGPFYPRMPVYCSVSGRTGSGKSTALLSLIPLLNKKTKYIIMCTTVKENVIHNNIEKWCKKRKRVFIKTHDVDEAKAIIRKMIDEKKETDQGLIIFDDWGDYSRNTHTRPNMLMSECFGRLRNFLVSCIIILQDYCSIPKPLRSNINLQIAFADNSVGSSRIRNLELGALSGIGDKQFLAGVNRQLNDQKDRHKFTIASPGQLYMCWDRVYPGPLTKKDLESDSDSDSDSDSKKIHKKMKKLKLAKHTTAIQEKDSD